MITKINNLIFEGVSPSIDGIDMGGNTITSHGTPVSPTDVVNKAYVDGLTGGGGGTTVSVSGSDTTPGLLSDKIIGGDGLSIETLNPGANEQLQLNVGDGRNAIINGAFNIWQRNTSFTVTHLDGGVYTADRWQVGAGDATSYSGTFARQTFSGVSGNPTSAPLYYMRWTTTTSSGGTTNVPFIGQLIEGVDTFAGETITVSFWARSSTLTPLTVAFRQDFGSGGSGDVLVGGGGAALGNAWSFFEFTVTLPSIDGSFIGAGDHLALGLGIPLNTTGVVDLTLVQIERGAKATAFQRTSRGEEWANCQRYYFKTYNEEDAPGTVTGEAEGLQAFVDGGGSAVIGVNGATCHFPSQMRVAPTVTLYNPTTGAVGTWGSGTAFPAATLNGVTQRMANVTIGAVTPLSENFHIHVVADAELS